MGFVERYMNGSNSGSGGGGGGVPGSPYGDTGGYFGRIGAIPNYDYSNAQPVPGGSLAQRIQQFNDDYASIVNANNGMLQGLNQDQRLPDREMNRFDRFAAQANQASERLAGITGFDPNAGMTPDNLVRFATSLPFQMASVVPDSISHGYEALTGRPVLEGDLEKNTMPGEDLTPIQRGADLLYTGVNIGGLFAGGTGRVLGTAGKFGGKVLGKMSPGTIVGDMAENAAKGMLSRAGIGGEKVAPFLQVGHDVIEEGTEEFAQSYLEDTRFEQLNDESFGRAVESAKWGALGGGIMSGTMLGVNKAMDYAKSNSSNPAAQVAGDASNPSGQVEADDNPLAPFNELRVNRGNLGQHISNTLAQAYKDDQGGKITEQPGSIVATHTIGDTNLGVNETVVGTAEAQGIWEQGRKSQDVLMDWFHLDKADDNARKGLENVFHGKVRDKAAVLNKMLSNAYPTGGAEIVVGRNPDTKNGGYKARVTQFVNGNSLQLNPLAYQIVGSDVDGDTSGLYFNTEGLGVNGYISEMLTDTNGNSNVEYKYSSMSNKNFNGRNGNLEDVMHSIFDRYTRTYGDNGESASNYFIRQLKDALADDSDARDSKMSSLFTKMQFDIQEMNNAGEFNGDSINHLDAMDQLFRETSSNPLQYAQNMAVDYTTKMLSHFDKDWSDLERQKPELAQLISTGNLGDVKTPVEMYPYIGMLTSASPRKGNPIYRQYAAMGYNMAKAVRAVASDLGEVARQTSMENVFEAAIRESFREAQMGIAPATAIEGMMDGIVAEYALANAGMSDAAMKSPRTRADLELLMNSWIGSWNHFRGVYNDALGELTDMGWKPAWGKSERNEITSIEDAAFIRNFRKFIGPLEADRIFPKEALTEENEDLTCDQLLEKYASDPTKYRQFMSTYTDGFFQSFFNRLVLAEGTENNAVEERVYESIESADTSGIQSRYEANGNRFDPGDTSALLSLMDCINNWVHVKASQRLNLGDPNKIVKTRVGRTLLFGSTDEKLVAIIGSNYYGKFVQVMEYFAVHENDVEIDEKVMNRLDDLAQIDEIHRRIANEIIDNHGRSLTLERLVSLDDTLTTKKNWVKEQFGEDNKTLNLVVSAMTAETDNTSSSSIGQRMAVVESSSSRYRAALRDNDIKIVTKVKELANSFPNADFAGFMRGRVNAGLCRVNMNILGMEVHDAAVVQNASIEKATTPGASQHKWSTMMHTFNGGLTSYLDTLSMERNGQITLDNFWSNRKVLLSILSDPTYNIEVHDPTTGRNAFIDRATLFKWVGFDIGSSEPNSTQWIALLEKCPQLAGWLTVNEVQTSTVNGEPKQGWSQAETLDQGFTKWNNETTSTRSDTTPMVDRQMNEGVMQTGNWLLNQTWYLPTLVRCIPSDQLQSCLVNPTRATEVLTSLHNRYSRGVYAGALLRSNNIAIENDKYFNRIVGDGRAEMALENIMEMFDSLRTSMELNQIRAAGEVGVNLADRQMLMDTYDRMMFNANVSLLLSGETIGGVSLNLAGLPLLSANVDSSAVDPNSVDAFINQVQSDFISMFNLIELVTSEFTEGALSNHSVSEEEIDDLVDKIAIMHQRENNDKFKKNLKSKLNAINGVPLDVAQFKAASKRLNLNVSVNGNSNFELPRMALQLDSLFTAYDEKAFRSKLKEIGKYAGIARILHDDGYVDSYVDDYRKCFDGNGYIVDSNAKALRRDLRQMVIQSIIDRFNGEYSSHYNNSYYRSLTTYVDNYNNMWDDVHNYLGSIRNSNGQVGYLWDDLTKRRGQKKTLQQMVENIPRPSFSNEVAEIVAGQLMIAEGSGGNPIKVGLNGGEAKKNSGINYLDNNIVADYEPITITAGELLRRYNSDEEIARCHIVQPGGSWNPTNQNAYHITTVENVVGWLRDPANANTQIQFFDPEDNPHGIYDSNMPESFNPLYTKYKRLPGIIARIVDASQEAMVLKSKKKFASRATIVDINDGARVDRLQLTPRGNRIDFDNTQQAYQAMRENYKKFIRNYADDLVNGPTSKDWADTLGFGKEQARIFAQGITIGYKVRIRTPEGVEWVTIDAGDLFKPAKFDETMQRIRQFGRIEYAEIQTVGVSELSMRVHNAVVEEQASREDQLTTDDTKQIAYDRLSDWSDYRYNTLSLDEVFGQMPSIGMFSPGGMLASDSRTRVQSFVNAMWGRDEGHFKKKTVKYTARSVDMSKDNHLVNLVDKINDTKLANHTNTKVIKTFMPSSYKTFDMNKQYFEALNRLTDTEDINYTHKNTYTDTMEYGCALVYDPDKLNAAIEWGVRTDQAILIPNSIYGSIPLEMKSMMGESVTLEVTKGGIFGPRNNKEEFYKLEPQKLDYIGSRLDVESPTNIQDTGRVTRILMDSDGVFGLADASMALKPEVMNNLMVPVASHKNIDTRDFFPHSTGPTRLMTVRELQDLRSKLGNSRNHNEWRAAGLNVHEYQKTWNFGDEEYMRRVNEYIDAAIAAGDHRLSSAVTSGQVVGIVADGTGRGERYYPLFIPNSAPNRCDWHNVEMIGSIASIQYTGRPTAAYMNLAGYSKYTLDKEAMKNIADQAEGIPDGVDGVANYMTEKGRVEGREKILMITSMFWDIKEKGGHLCYVRDGRNRYKWNDALPAECRDATLRNMEGNKDNLWYQMRIGDFRILEKMHPELANDNVGKSALRIVAKQCNRLKINPMFVFGHESLTKDGKISPLCHDAMIHGVFGTLNEDQILRVFHYMGASCNMNEKAFCPLGLSDNSNKNNTRWDALGRMRVNVQGKWGYHVVRCGLNDLMGHMSEVESVGGIASWSPQHLYRRAADSGVLDEQMARTLQYSDFLTHNYQFIQEKKRLVDQQVSEEMLNNLHNRNAVYDADALYTNTYLEVKENRIIGETLNRTMGQTRSVYDGDEKIADPMTDKRISDKYRELCDAFGYKPSWRLVMQMVDLQDGYAYGNGENTALGISTLRNTIDQIVRNQKQYGLPVYNPNGSRSLNGRVAIPLLPPEIARFHYDHSGTSKHFHGSYDNFRQAMFAAMDDAEVIINAIPANESRRKRALRRLGEALNRENDRESHFGYIYGGCWADEVIKADGTLGMVIRGSDFDERAYDELVSQAQKKMQDMQERAQKFLRKRGVEVPTEFGGNLAMMKSNDGQVIANVCNNLTTLTKLMAIANPAVFASNMLDRSIHQGITKAALWIGGNLKLGPYRTAHRLNQNIVKAAVNDPLFIKMYTAYRTAGFNGDEVQFLANARSVEQINQFMDNKLAQMSPFEKASAKVFDLASGGNWLIKGQMENFINRFAMFCESTPGLEFWFQEDPQSKQGDPNAKGTMYLEAALANNPAHWFVDILGGNAGMSASLTAALQAMNSAKAGDMAQRHSMAEIMTGLAKRTSLGNLLFTSTISRFPNYSFNVTQRMLNWVLPMSSLYYVFTDYAARIESAHAEKTGKPSMHLEDTQVHRNLKEALLVDMTKIGTFGVACILIGVSGMFEPPDDEDKWGNVDEWLFFGHRIGESWWMQDILGMALPLAAFSKSAQMGKPNINLLINGTAQACYSNPIIRISDAVGFLCEPEGNFFTDYEIDRMQYENAYGGAPSFTDYLQSQGVSFGLSWASQFITPSFIREWYNNNQQFERSYKRVYEETGAGVLSEDGEAGTTMMTTYGDAMIRRATRRNPVLGWLMDVVRQPTTGYMAHEMPYTIYTDDAQRESKDYWSVAGLDEDATNAKCMEIIAYMQQFNSTEDMKETGFYLDYETKAAVSETIWDIYHTYEYQWRQMGASGQLSYTLLGNGDFDAGKAIFYQMQDEVDAQKQYWYDFYYDRIKNSYLTDPIQTYRRYNTTYARDDKGEVYATGFRPQGFLPFISAPGTINNPEGTAGYENDWVTPSAVTGEPMVDKRALVPVPGEYDEWPDMESWSADGNGNQYSKRGQSQNGTTGDTSNIKSSNASNGNGAGNSGGSGSGRRYGGGGGGGGRGGRGGGGGYSSAPNIYARGSSPNMASPRTMDRVNTGWANLDYLRPSFETKGSREAYRREDI